MATVFIGIIGVVLAIFGIAAALRSPAPPPLPDKMLSPGKIRQGQNNSSSGLGCLVLFVLAAGIGGFVWLIR
jgi:hypothetical protein